MRVGTRVGGSPVSRILIVGLARRDGIVYCRDARAGRGVFGASHVRDGGVATGGTRRHVGGPVRTIAQSVDRGGRARTLEFARLSGQLVGFVVAD